MRLTLFSLSLIFLLYGFACGKVSFEASVDKLESVYEEKVRLILRVEVSDPAIRTSPIPPPETPGFSLGGSRVSVSREGDMVVRNYIYSLVPRRSGQIAIPAFMLEYSDSTGTDTLVSEPIMVSVAEPVPVEDEVGAPWWVVIVALVVLVVGATWWYRRTARVEKPSGDNWQHEFRERLGAIKQLAEREDYRSFSVEAMRMVVSLLEYRHNQRLGSYTTRNLVKLLEQEGYDEDQLALFRDLFTFCENVKYSPGAVTVEEGRKSVQRLEKTVELLLE